MTRLLAPEMFGLMALVNITLQGLELFSDFGIRTAIIQHRQGEDRRFLDTAWTVQIVRGLALWLFTVIIAWPAAWCYGQETLIYVIPVAGLIFIFAGFTSTALYTHERRISLAKPTLLEVGSRAASILAMIAVALVTHSIWPLVAGLLVFWSCKAIGSQWLSTQRNRFAWDQESRRFLFRFGGLVMLSSGALFISNQGERLIMGKFVSMGDLGVYSIAYTFASLAQGVVALLAAKVLLPSYARLLRTNPERALVRYRHSRHIMLCVGAAMMGAMIAFGPILIGWLYDPRYAAAAWMVQILSIESFCEIVQSPTSQLLLASGKPKYGAMANVLRGLLIIVGIYLAFVFFDLRAAVWVIPMSAVVSGRLYTLGAVCTHRSLKRDEVVTELTILAFVVSAAVLVWQA